MSNGHAGAEKDGFHRGGCKPAKACNWRKHLMADTLHDPDNDRSCRNPQAWIKTKLAFGWKPRAHRRDRSSLVSALLDLEDHARNGGECVRLVLELAIRNYLRLNPEEKRQARISIFADYDRQREVEQIERDFREALKKCGILDEPANAPPDDRSS